MSNEHKCDCDACKEHEEHDEKHADACECASCAAEETEEECEECKIAAEEQAAPRVTEFQVENLDCADCARKLEQRVASYPGVISSGVNFATAAIKVEHTCPASEIMNIIEDSGYKVSGSGIKVTEFEVAELDCVDCAQKFEKAIQQTSGVLRANLNFTLGKLTVEHTCDVEDIIDAASDIGYKIHVAGSKKEQPFFSRYRPMIITGVSGALTILGFIAGQLGAQPIVPIALYMLAIIIGGYHVAKSAIYSLKTLTADMNLLMTIAIVGAVFIGQWEEAATVVFLFALGNALQSYTMDKTRNSIRSLISLSPKEASVLREGKEIKLNTGLIKVGDIMLVRPGEKIAMDGEVIDGSSYVNQANITGESMPVEKAKGNEIYAGTINMNGSLEVRVTKLAKDNTLSKIVHMVEEAQANKAPTQVFLDRFTKYYTPAVILLAAAVVIVPTLLGQPFDQWLYRGLVLLVIACPCALVISTPVSIVSAIGSASRNGVLIKGGSYLEEMGRARALAFDKTGTLTMGKPSVSDVIAFDSYSKEEIMNIAAALESRSEHPLAAAILRANHNGHSLSVENFRSVTGKGVMGTVSGREYRIGNLKLFEHANEDVKNAVDLAQEAGKTPLLLGDDHEVMAMITVTDEIRPESRQIVSALHRQGLKEVIMLTGDNKRVAKALSADIGLDGYFAELLPEDKAKIVNGIKKAHGVTVMVGDGVNDAPALAASNVGIAMGATGSDAALETADIALMSNDLSRVEYTIRLGKYTLVIIKENVMFAIAIKVVFITLAVFGLANLWMAVFADMGASLIVTLNGMRLITTKP
jgi:Cd2+/Zn2+-exporting ATPase